MPIKRYVLVSAAVLAAGAGGGAAIAATTGGDDDHKKAEQSILDDAAKRLNVTPDALRSALGAAEDAQLDQQVRDGKLTQEQADAIKKRRADSGEVLGPGAAPGGPGGPGRGGMMHPGFGLGFKTGPGGALDGAATALGLSRADLLKQLRAGRSIADIAKAQNKSLDDVKTAITAAVTKELDQQVADRKLTADQEKKILDELKSHLDDLVNNTPPSRPKGAPDFGPRHHWR